MSAQDAQPTPLEGRLSGTPEAAQPGLPNGVQQMPGTAGNANLPQETGVRSEVQESVSPAVPVGRSEAQDPPRTMEPASVLEQAERLSARTTLDMGSGPPLATGAASRQSVMSNDFLTPRSVAPVQGQQTWLGSLEWPRWMTRLGSYVAPISSDLLPSPLPSQATPPGGQAFMLRSPVRQRPVRRPPTPPSSSSIPAEAIQQEVQRQLGSLLSRLDDAESRNMQLLRDLELAKAEAEDARAQAQQRQPSRTLRDGGLFGDPPNLLGSPTDPSGLGGLFDAPPQLPVAPGGLLASEGDLGDPRRLLEGQVDIQLSGGLPSAPLPVPGVQGECVRFGGQQGVPPHLLGSPTDP